MKFCYDCANIIEENIQRCPYCGGNLNDAEPKEAYHLKPGTTLKNGRYLLGRAIGYGGFGVTYAGFDLTLQRRVAIKEYFPLGYANRSVSESKLNVYTGDRMAQYGTGLSHFLLEARNMAKFGKEPNIVSVLDFFEENNTAYIVMEYLDGMDLKHYLRQVGGILPYKQAIEIIRPVCRALAKVHKEGVIHRDISPDNIFITDDNIIKLIDFGAARLALGDREKTLSVILKPGFAPPEQYRTKSAQGSYTDIYALAATFYRMITGKMPPASTDRLIGDVLVPPSAVVKGIPKNVDNAVMQAMALDAGARFAAAIDFLKALERKSSKAVPAPLPLDVREKNKEPSASHEKTNKVRNIIIAAVSGVVVCALLFTMLYLSGVLGGNTEPIVFATPMPMFTPMPTPTPNPTPKPTPTPEITAAPTPSPEPSPAPVAFCDANFEAAFRSRYHIFGTITPEMLLSYTELDLSECALTDISDVAMFENLQVLTLRKNEISDIEPISALTGLTSLDLFTNKISDISPLFMLTGLATLNLGVNEITDIRLLSRFTDLVWLNLNYNQITDISSLAGLTKLEHLNLHDNKVTYIGALSRLTSLTWLNLNRCGLTAYTDVSPLYDLIWLEELYIKKGNSLTQTQIDTIQTYLTGTMIH